MTETIAELNLLTRTPQQVLALVDALPAWDPHLDDDPNWVIPVAAVGLRREPRHLDFERTPLHDISTGARPAELVPVTGIQVTGQPFVRLDAIAHYLRTPGTLFDPEGFWGQDEPLLLDLGNGTYRVLDGTNRAAAAKLRRDEHIRAYVMRPHEWWYDTAA